LSLQCARWAWSKALSPGLVGLLKAFFEAKLAGSGVDRARSGIIDEPD